MGRRSGWLRFERIKPDETPHVSPRPLPLATPVLQRYPSLVKRAVLKFSQSGFLKNTDGTGFARAVALLMLLVARGV